MAATRGDAGGAKSRPGATLKKIMDMLSFTRGAVAPSNFDGLLTIICRETITQFIDGHEHASITGIPLAPTSERQFRADADAIVAHPFFENCTVSYTIEDINKHPGSPRNLWADFEVRWE